jgi:excisionase family DNA binding protein
MAKRIRYPGLLSYESVCRALDCSKSTIKRLVKKGLLPAPEQVPGVGARWWEDDIEQYLHDLKKRKKGQQQS